MSIQSNILSGFIYLFSILPFWVLYRISDFLYLILYYVIRYRRPVVQLNLANSFPEKSDHERLTIEKKFYRFLADLFVENLKMRSMSAAESKKRLVLTNRELPLGYLAKGQPVIFVTGHYANWEWGIHSLSLMSDKPALIIYKPLNDKLFEGVYNSMRSRFGATMVPMQQTLRKIMEYRNVPHTSVFLADQTPNRQASNFFIPFLNQPTAAFKGIEKIAQKLDFPIIFCHIDRLRRGYYTAHFTLLSEHPRTAQENEITLLHNRFLEKIIEKKPELWLWSHKRWKYKAHDES